MSDGQDFYRAFEDKYRGSRDSIKERLEVYRPFVEPLLKAASKPKAIDLGCGRGEWIELVGEIGFDATGVDLDAGMLEAAETKGLNVEQADVIEFLERQPESSIAMVSGFHIAEHLPFGVLQSMVEQAHRVLMPGGLLILETPNPENVTVGASSFYMDPTHERPLPSELLSFLTEFYGFFRTSVLRLQEPEEVREGGPSLRLLDVFQGVSPDYSVVAQKEGDAQATTLLNAAFEKPYGVSLASLAVRYDDQVTQALERTAELAELAAEKAELAGAKAELAEEKARRAEEKAERAEVKSASAEIKAERCESRAVMAETELASVYGSRSWRVTRPLRWAAFQFALLRQHGFVARMKALANKLLAPALLFMVSLISSRPRLRKFCIRVAQKLGLYSRVRNLYHGSSFFRTDSKKTGAFDDLRTSSESLDQLSPQARRTYFRLRSAIDKQRRQV